METLKEFVKNGEENDVVVCVKSMLDQGKGPVTIVNEGLIPAMDVVGDLFQKGEYYMPEMLMAAQAMQKGLDIVKPMLIDEGIEPLGKVVLGTVEGDIHDIGKNLVMMILESIGFEVVDLGTEAPPNKFVEAIDENKPCLVGMSALLTTTMASMEKTIDVIKSSDIGDSVKIMIGGAPVTKQFADDIGADYYGEDAISARNIAREVVNGKK